MSTAEGLRNIFVARDGKIDTTGATTLQTPDARRLRGLLGRSSEGAIYNSGISLSHAFRSMEMGHYSWSIVQSYYSYFYSLQALLGSLNYFIFYPRARGAGAYIQIRAGERPHTLPRAARGSSHQSVTIIHSRVDPNSSASTQLIENEAPSEWIRSIRERSNYQQTRFIEPAAPKELKKIVALGARKSFNAFLDNDNYAFDPDYAALALPTWAFKEACTAIRRLAPVQGSLLSDNDRQFAAQLFSDAAGPISSFRPLIYLE
jgi:hypothetical protein